MKGVTNKALLCHAVSSNVNPALLRWALQARQPSSPGFMSQLQAAGS